MEKGLLIVISGPAGSGKGTVVAELLKDPAYAFSVSATTRAPRPGELNGVNYHFLSREEFDRRIEAGEMLEHTEYCGNCYGTPKKEALEVLETGRHLILEIEVEGAFNVRRAYPEAVLIMLLPPSFAVQEARLRGRGTESEEKIALRLATARREVPLVNGYDYVVRNDDGEILRAVEDIRAIVRAESRAVRRQGDIAGEYFRK